MLVEEGGRVPAPRGKLQGNEIAVKEQDLLTLGLGSLVQNTQVGRGFAMLNPYLLSGGGKRGLKVPVPASQSGWV